MNNNLITIKVESVNDLYDWMQLKTPFTYISFMQYAYDRGYKVGTVKGVAYSSRIKYSLSPVCLPPMTLVCKYCEWVEGEQVFKKPYNTYNKNKVDYIMTFFHKREIMHISRTEGVFKK